MFSTTSIPNETGPDEHGLFGPLGFSRLGISHCNASPEELQIDSGRQITQDLRTRVASMPRIGGLESGGAEVAMTSLS